MSGLAGVSPYPTGAAGRNFRRSLRLICTVAVQWSAIRPYDEEASGLADFEFRSAGAVSIIKRYPQTMAETRAVSIQ